MKKGGKGICGILLWVLLGAVLIPMPVQADTGPKPSVVIDFQGLEGKYYYATLLSETKSTGPHFAVDAENGGEQTYQESYEDYEIYSKFLEYEDSDGFYFLQYFADCSKNQQFVWGYYPPERFKILLYFPEEDRFLTNEQILERYAFDSYYTVTAEEDGFITEKTDRTVEKLQHFGREALFLGIRVLITLAVELGIAWVFGIREQNQILIVTVTNIVTQLALNLSLYLLYSRMGNWALFLCYVPLELLVFFAEALAYLRFLNRKSQTSVSAGRIWGYALTANACSFVLGILLGNWIPQIM